MTGAALGQQIVTDLAGDQQALKRRMEEAIADLEDFKRMIAEAQTTDDEDGEPDRHISRTHSQVDR